MPCAGGGKLRDVHDVRGGTNRKYPVQAEVEEMEDKLKSLESICSPIISKMYQGGARLASAYSTHWPCLLDWRSRH